VYPECVIRDGAGSDEGVRIVARAVVSAMTMSNLVAGDRFEPYSVYPICLWAVPASVAATR
jgi:hypothetical protein